MQRVVANHGNRMWSRPREWADTPRCGYYTSPQLLRMVSADLSALGCYELAASIAMLADEWDEAPENAERLCRQALTVTGLSDSSKIRLDIVLENFDKKDR